MASARLSWVALVAGLASVAAGAAQPPIIDRNAFFGEVQISGAQLSPDARFISFLKPYRGTRNLWVKKAGEPFSAARPVSLETARPIRSYFWSRDSRYLLYVQDAGGDENFNVYAIDPLQAPDAATGVPPTRALTNLKGVRAQIYAVPRAKPDVLYVGLNDRDPKWHDLYELHLATGQMTLLRANTAQVSWWGFDNQGTLRLAERTTPAGDTEILRVDGDELRPVYRCSVLESCSVHSFAGDDRSVYLTTNQGTLDRSELELLDVGTGAVRKVESDPLGRVDVGGAVVSDIDHRIFYTEYADGRPRRYFHDKAFEADVRWLQRRLAGAEFRLDSRSADEREWIVTAYSDRDPGTTYLWDRGGHALTLQYRLREDIPRAALSSRVPYEFASSDGRRISGYLTLPQGLAARHLPLVVWPHGGPWARDTYGYDTFAQFLANRGYAVLQPNFRGSDGFGKEFLNAGNGEWGRKMQDDLTWGVKALVAAGIADPRRVGIGGGSYGGYATLAGVAFTPSLYAAAVAVVAPSNLLTLLDAIPPYWESGRRQMYTRMADPTTPAGRALLVAESPLTQAKAIVTPLLVVQGKNDPRVNVRESDQIVAAVRDNGRPVEYLVAPDEGHGFARPINNLAFVTAMERFYAKHLGGRVQADVPADVAARLVEITVDPATVSGAASLEGALKPDSQ
ncbi:MAG: S9 family peptidase [Proteobacteria bacterium]|nr:S9 family peptidase [Pseudomonadota bacterium]